MTSITHNPTPNVQPRTGGSWWRRLGALAKAESLQFLRNPLLLALALIAPPILPLFVFFVGDQGVFSTIMAAELFLLVALAFVVYFSALSMVTTRRDEKVLKRLRTGEARDWEILTAVAIPLTAIMLVLAVLVVVVVSLLSMMLSQDAEASNVWPRNPLLMLLALVLSIALSHGFALWTSRYTANAENAQMTSLPLVLVMMASVSFLRFILLEPVNTVLGWNPFALAIDLIRRGWVGEHPMMPETGETWIQVAVLIGWTVLAITGGYRRMRWEPRR